MVAEIKRAWCYYLFAREQQELYKQQAEMAGRLQRAGEIRYEQGDITLLEKSMCNTMAAEMRNKLFQANEELRMAAIRLKWACYTDEDIVPADKMLTLLPLEKQPATENIRMNLLQSQTEEKKAMLRIEQSRFFPESRIVARYLPQDSISDVLYSLFFTVADDQQQHD